MGSDGPHSQLAEALSDRYTIEREVGAGGMATVFLAEDKKHGRKVALKALRPELAAAMGSERFQREIKMVAQFNHPHILSLYDSGETAGFLFYVMPFVEGESLRERLDREKQLPFHDAMRMNVVWDRTNAVPTSISPTGDSVVAMVEQANGKMHSMILPAAGGAGRMILGPDEFSTGIGAWSSDGKFLLYATTVNNVFDLGVLTIADGTTRRLTTTPESEDGAEFAPDGKTVVFRRSTTVQRLYRAVIK